MAEADYLRGLFEELRDELLAELRAERDRQPLLTVPRAAERLGVSQRTVRDMVNADPPVLASFHVGPSNGVRVIEASVVEDYIDKRRRAGAMREDRGPTT